ncbi:helix-turn-helix domain-containing protein [Arthrobacter sp. StoSoilB5]|uniref:helix-turn-helix domain-containing protein n=1 Tax=Arthrobacter sp. StoSoilB5 TaxID=2830992 RepID=UPI001CC3B186|nr:helix-turn-helix domain-containing protein [Arthrobacter sp. StoSoilB5]BCW44812.1 AraC family transcriptional regulator [Arthrobacter sp. StoSoilB5]
MTSVPCTRSVPPAERRDYWSAGIAERFFPMHVESVEAPSFEARLAGGQMGPVGVQWIQGLAHRVARTQRMIATADPECILLYLMTRGMIQIEQDDRSCALGPGDIACQDTSRPSTFEGREGFEVIVFSIPKWFIGAQAEGLARRSATRVDSGQGRLAGPATPFLAQLARTTISGSGFSSPDGEGAAQMLLPLLRSMYGVQEISHPRSRPQALLDQMQRYVINHLHDPELGPDQIAQAHFVSTRYVHKLFAATGTGVSAWIRERRFEGAVGELRRSPETTIATVAARWGYRHPASFSRAFREVHGCAPREARHLPDPSGKPPPFGLGGDSPEDAQSALGESGLPQAGAPNP